MDSRYELWNRAALLRYQQRERAILHLLDRHGFRPLDGVRILDVGCRDGGTLRDFLEYGASPENLAGIDLRANAIARARRLAPHLDYRVADAAELPFDDGSFDLALAFTFFSATTDPMKRKQCADEMVRVLRPGGAVLWYDFWLNPVNPDLQGLGLGELKRLFGQRPVEARRVTLAPPIARMLAPRSWFACEVAAKLPLACSHWLALVPVPGTNRCPPSSAGESSRSPGV